MADWPPSLKPIGKYIVRAREVQTTQPLVAYYCNYYALKRAIELRDQSDEKANRLVTGLLEKCEAAKVKIGPDDSSHRGIVEEFALSVFDRADTEDREDRATKETAQTFYAAACFFEVCRVFAPLTSDLEQRLRYAKWKAVDISKALKEGRRPIPGAPGEAEALEEERRAAKAEKLAAEKAAAETAAAERAAAEQAAATPSLDLGQGTDDRQDIGAGYPQGNQAIPPAPPLREYDSDLHEYQPQPVSKGRLEGVVPYPSVAPPYPSEDLSPLPQQGQYPAQSNSTSAYPSMSTAYPTTDGPYGDSSSTYPATSGYPTPSAPPFMAPSAPYATEDVSRVEPSKGPVMPPIPGLDIPGMGTNMGDPPAAQRYRPPQSEPFQAAQQPEDVHAPPRSDPGHTQSMAEPAHLRPRSDHADHAPRSQPVHGAPHHDAYAPPRSEAVHGPPRSEPAKGPPRSDAAYPPQSDGFAAQLPGTMPARVPAVPRLGSDATSGGVVSSYKPSVKDAQEAQRLAKYAASALDFQDLKTAVANLEDALRLLKGGR